MKNKILALAEKYANIIDAEIAKLEVSVREGMPAEDFEAMLSGKLIFLTELYQHTTDPRMLPLLERGAILLVRHIKTRPTANWCFYNGRAGTIYALLHIWFITKDERITDTILEKIKDVDLEFGNSEYVSDFLFDGKAGILLMLFGLYKSTGHGSLVPMINNYITGMLDRAQYTDEGLCWKRYEEIILRPSCGMAFGVSGIKSD